MPTPETEAHTIVMLYCPNLKHLLEPIISMLSSIILFWLNKRDLYKHIHNWTLQYANKGYYTIEIKVFVRLPASLNKERCCRGFYGLLNHNINSQYQLCFGTYDSNPEHLDELPPCELAVNVVEMFGGVEKQLAIGQEVHNKGEYRWLATILNHLVFF
ncbi:hypothetical protein EIN_450890 [Entamoeba invadens IP1]|uniref:Alkyl sulfatase dimerisation domain-containing protein n=1 Tax=Entamoeba invadens IP1 TaxID=370355 RepID=A0A0A1UCW7_ENTIV|nr:hypothetical protein EIN_450890 [Entamoeba invadens IP1]ELP91518.1 hypothetical protein EIN_450890 [Entamoeba invadens IP1]|eukprot:XP_004258289.1 hypothetical protein EIN_450890 [Entamoeba invadens IP1]